MRGLPNIGSTCYFNTAVQCLAHVPCLTNTLLRKPYEGHCVLTREFSRLVYNLWSEDGQPDPRPLLLAFRTRFPSFDPGQHDAQEAFLCLVDALENSLGKEFIKKIFTPFSRTDFPLTIPHKQRRGGGVEDLGGFPHTLLPNYI